MTRAARHLHLIVTTAVALSLMAVATTARADRDDHTIYVQTNLVSNQTAEGANPADPDLQNSWGVANIPGGPLWIADNNSGLSTLYDGDGVKNGLKVTIPLPPSRKAPPPAAPTGMVWNPTSGFPIPIPGTNKTAAAIFIWVSEDGTITAWNPAADPIMPDGKGGLTSTASLVVDNSGAGAVYKGVAFGTNKHGTFLFVTNIFAGTVEVYDSSFKPVKPGTFDGNFSDPTVPAGFAPFGIALVDNNIFVTYARQNAAKNDVVAGAGEGFVNVFNTEGVKLRRFASRGVLNAPWGVTRATAGFGEFSGDILVGNFGDEGNFAGWINAFDEHGDFRGELRDAHGKPISINGLWSLVFGTFLKSDADTLYFTAGPNEQTNGLFGKIVAMPAVDDDHDNR
jgi:uncharacterized protein (TIGR03118 family)